MFRLPENSTLGPLRFLGLFGGISLLFLVAVDVLVELAVPVGPGQIVLTVGLDSLFVLIGGLFLRQVLERQLLRLRRVNESLGTRIETRTSDLEDALDHCNQADADLRGQMRRLHDMADMCSDWLWETGPDHRFSYVSARFSELTGLTTDLVVGKLPAELFQPADASQPSLANGPLQARQAFRNVFVRMALGEDSRWMNLSGKPVIDAAGQFRGFRGAGEDVTDRLGHDRAASDLRRRYELILQSIGEGVFGLDRDGRFTFVNPAAQSLLDRPVTELMEKSALSVLTPEPPESLSLEGDIVADRRYRPAAFRRKDGAMLPVEYVLTPLRDGKTLTGAVVAFRDVTEQKRSAAELVAAKERAEASTRAKSNFLAHISHQLRTPLNSISGFADVMRNEYFGPIENERYREYVEDIGRSASHLGELIDDLVDLARIEAGRLELDQKPSDISTLAEDALSMIRGQAASAGCSLQNNVPGNLPLVYLDPTRFKQILLNLLTNAVKFTPANGRIAIMAEMEPDGGLLVRVSDTGQGMTEEQVERATLSYDQGSASVRSDKAGFGFGLPLARQLMELHGGGLSIASQPQQGTIVTLRLPPGRIGGAKDD